MSSYAIVFDLALLEGKNGEPNPVTATIYNMIATQAHLVGHAIKNGKLEDPVPYLDLIADRPETDRAKIIEWLDFNDLQRPRALRLANDDIGNDQILAVFDADPKRIVMWREINVSCFQLEEPPRIALPNLKV
jgi:hypothetical protein